MRGGFTILCLSLLLFNLLPLAVEGIDLSHALFGFDEETEDFIRNAPLPPLPNKIDADKLVPIMLIPPMIGSTLTAKLHHSKEPHFFCKSTGEMRLWYPSKLSLFPLFDDCLIHNFHLKYNQSSDLEYAEEGVEVVIDDSLLSLLKNDSKTVGPFARIGAVLESLGYVGGQNLAGFPYDWRLVPHQYMVENGPFQQLKEQIELLSRQNNNASVLAVSMSMGAPWFVSFLEYFVDQEWKDRYISSVLSLSGLFAGSSVATQYQVSPMLGWQHSMSDELAGKTKSLIQTWGSVTWFAPSAEFYGDRVFVETKGGRKYSAKNLDQLFIDAGSNITAEMWQNTRKYPTLSAPGVEMFVWYGYNCSTPCHFLYNENDWKTMPDMEICDGDTLATLDSMVGPPLMWQKNQTQPVHLLGFPNVIHGATLYDDLVMTSIGNLVEELANRPKKKSN